MEIETCRIGVDRLSRRRKLYKGLPMSDGVDIR